MSQMLNGSATAANRSPSGLKRTEYTALSCCSGSVLADEIDGVLARARGPVFAGRRHAFARGVKPDIQYCFGMLEP